MNFGNLQEIITDVKNAIFNSPQYRKDFDRALMYQVIELCGESGEVAEAIKKQLRKGLLIGMDANTENHILLELGDVLWALTACCCLLGVTLDDIAQLNQEKLKKRRAENKLDP